ncbi:MAG TPA: ribosome small subunit-dependent GTPase A [Candidatus Binatia bacterium]|nr:ribosome small subunit-dependent GTPase A [Candidatus Binatia bacterium]
MSEVVGAGAADPMTAASLRSLGWDGRLEALFATEASGLEPARILVEERGRYLVATAAGEAPASPSGRLRHEADLDPTAAWPAVGDWVAVEGSAPGAGPGEHRLIQQVLPRRTAVVRRAPSDRRLPAQVLAANVDTVFVVTSMNADFNVRRLERYLSVAWESGAWPVVLLSKADLAGDPGPYVAAAAAVAAGVDVVPVSIVTGEGLDTVRALLGEGRTVVFTGSSGVGKSSIVNAIAGETVVATAAIREDDARGRHTTTRRQLLRIGNAVLIDTPGLRELGVLDAEGVSTAFDDVEQAASRCRFNDCAHRSEPGCAVRAAIADGSLDGGRFDAWKKLEREAAHAALATDAIARRAERKRWSAISRSVDAHVRIKYGADR